MDGIRRLVHMHQKGRLTLPAAIRRRLRLSAGDVLALEDTERGVLMMPQGAREAATLSDAITPEELARRRAVVAEIRNLREQIPSIAPLTAADLVRMGREEEGPSFDPGA